MYSGLISSTLSKLRTMLYVRRKAESNGSGEPCRRDVTQRKIAHRKLCRYLKKQRELVTASSVVIICAPWREPCLHWARAFHRRSWWRFLARPSLFDRLFRSSECTPLLWSDQEQEIDARENWSIITFNPNLHVLSVTFVKLNKVLQRTTQLVSSLACSPTYTVAIKSQNVESFSNIEWQK